jgi:hypothetical protein
MELSLISETGLDAAGAMHAEQPPEAPSSHRGRRYAIPVPRAFAFCSHVNDQDTVNMALATACSSSRPISRWQTLRWS